MLNERRKPQLEQRERISLTVEVGNMRPSRFHLKVAETPAADTLLETKEQQRMKWCLKHGGTILFIYLVCLNTGEINAPHAGYVCMPPNMQRCIMVHSWGKGGSVETSGSGHQRLMLHSHGAAVVKPLYVLC